MKKILILLLLMISTFSYSQTVKHNSRVKIKNTPVALATDTIIAIRDNGLIVKTALPVGDVTPLNTYQETATVTGEEGEFTTNYVVNIGDVDATGNQTSLTIDDVDERVSIQSDGSLLEVTPGKIEMSRSGAAMKVETTLGTFAEMTSGTAQVNVSSGNSFIGGDSVFIRPTVSSPTIVAGQVLTALTNQGDVGWADVAAGETYNSLTEQSYVSPTNYRIDIGTFGNDAGRYSTLFSSFLTKFVFPDSGNPFSRDGFLEFSNGQISMSASTIKMKINENFGPFPEGNGTYLGLISGDGTLGWVSPSSSQAAFLSVEDIGVNPNYGAYNTINNQNFYFQTFSDAGKTGGGILSRTIDGGQGNEYNVPSNTGLSGSTIFGDSNTLNGRGGAGSFIAGDDNEVFVGLTNQITNPFIIGNDNKGYSNGNQSYIILGNYNEARAPYETSIGFNGSDYTYTGTDSDRRFNVGNGSGTDEIDSANGLTLLINGELTAGTTEIADIISAGAKSLITKEYADANYAGGGGAGAFEVVDEGSGDGIVVAGRTAANYGDVGLNARDLGTSTNASTTRGATGNYSLTSGQNVEASGLWSFAGGFNSVASGAESLAFGADVTATAAAAVALGRLNNATSQYTFVAGFQNNATNTYATALGFQNTSSGQYSSTFGQSVFARSAGEFAVGTYSTDYTPNSTLTFDAEDRVFNVGNGTSTTRSDAFTVYKNGAVQLHAVDPANVTNLETGMLIIDSTDANRLKFYDGTAWRTLAFL